MDFSLEQKWHTNRLVKFRLSLVDDLEYLMATLATSNSAKKLRSLSTNKKINSQSIKIDEKLNKLRFDLSSALQTSLELEATLKTFFGRVCAVLHCSGLTYTNKNNNVDIHIGVREPHSAVYNVSSDEEQLGELNFYRNYPYAESELAVLEILIGVLFYPLRNALKYKAALQNGYADALTGLNNRQALEMASLREIKLAQRHRKALSLLMIDIDHFKNINDQYGHLAGDAVLAHIAHVTSQTLRESDQVFRYGGEEFVALLSETPMEQALMTAERIRQAVEYAHIHNNNKCIKVTTSVGVSSLTMTDSFENLFQRADDALYTAKSEGRNKVQCLRKQGEIKKSA